LLEKERAMSRLAVLFVALAVTGVAKADPGCTFSVPEGWSPAASSASAQVSFQEPESSRTLRGTLSLRAPLDASLGGAVERAKREAASWLTGREKTELVRDEALPGGDSRGRLLVYRYRLPNSRWFGLRYYAMVPTALGIAELTADTPAIYIDAIRGRKYEESGGHEKEIIHAIQSAQCGR
jgi:hypothetical protein